MQEMNEQEMKKIAMDKYVNIQRIKAAPDRDKEIEYQEKIAKAELQMLGISTEELDYTQE